MIHNPLRDANSLPESAYYLQGRMGGDLQGLRKSQAAEDEAKRGICTVSN